MTKRTALKSRPAKEAVAILAVDNIKLSDFGYDVLKRSEDGLITYQQAKDEILTRAKGKMLELKSPNRKVG